MKHVSNACNTLVKTEAKRQTKERKSLLVNKTKHIRDFSDYIDN